MKKIILPVVSALLLWAVAGAQAADGWYLMSPPFSVGADLIFRVDRDAPLSRWMQMQESVFASKGKCEDSKLSNLFFRDERYRKNPESATAQALVTLVLAWQCVAATDPRLPADPPKYTGLFHGDATDEALGTIRYTPGRPIIATVKLNGRTTARLILDTGADGSMVKPALLSAAGVDLSRPSARGKATGVTGKIEVSYFAVDFEVAGHRARVPRVAAFNTHEYGFADGLLGRDFLDQFSVAMDPAAGTVTLVPR